MGFKPQSGDDDLQANHEINVTPFVDVMLVLLIIVMVAAPLATVNVPVELPASSAKSPPKASDLFYLTVQEKGNLVIGEDNNTTLDNLPDVLSQVLSKKDTVIYLRADKGLVYDDLMKLMNVLAANGYTKVALVGLASES